MAEEKLSPQAAALLSQPGTPDVKDYLQHFAAQNLPNRNVVFVAQGEDVGTQVREGLAAALDRNPATRQQVVADPRLQRDLNEYASSVAATVARVRDDKGLSREQGNEDGGGPAGFFSLGTGAPANLRRAGMELIVVSIDGKSGCRNCKREHDGPIACAEASAPATSSLSNSPTLNILSSVNTGFHEMAHGLDLQGRSNLSVNFEARFTIRDYGNQIENTANAFATLMMIREFGELGRLQVEQQMRSEMSLPANGAHYNVGAMRDALRWAAENPEALRSASVESLFERSRQIGIDNTLTRSQTAEINNYIGAAFSTSGPPVALPQIMQQHRAELGVAAAGLDNAAQRAGVELGRLAATSQLSCPAEPRAEAEPAAAAPATATATPVRLKPAAIQTSSP